MYGRLPTASEIDQIEYLPSSRWIQLQYGGLEKLRTLLGYEQPHFGKGSFRTAIAKRVNMRGRNAELKLESILQEKFGEVFVHTEKIFDKTHKNRVDFYIYSPDGNFGVDIFFPDTIKTLAYNVNSKMKKYKLFSDRLYLVVANTGITQDELDKFTNAKKNVLPQNMELLSLEAFLLYTQQKRYYIDPLRTKGT